MHVSQALLIDNHLRDYGAGDDDLFIGVMKLQPNSRNKQTASSDAGCGRTAQKILGKKRTVSRVFFLFATLVFLVANLVATGKSFSTAHHELRFLTAYKSQDAKA
ncbi:hypothetical protein ACU8KH_00486 [Lachancea thermotolerans]